MGNTIQAIADVPMNVMKMTRITNNNTVTAPANPVVQSTVDYASRMRWGKPVWTFFHVLIDRIKDESFLEMKSGLVIYLRKICSMLPCPTCSTHATQYLSNIQFDRIETKQEMKYFMFTFHNYVNKRKGVPLAIAEEILPQYETYPFVSVYNNFVTVYLEKSTNGFKLNTDTIQKQMLVRQINSFIQSNLHCFTNITT
jgi:hypothetical protein